MKLFDFAAELKWETPNGFLLTDGTKDFWVPKVLIEQNGDGTWTIPEWLAVKKGIA